MQKVKKETRDLVNFNSYLANVLTSALRYNPRLSTNVDDVNKVFTVVGEFHIEVDLDIFRAPYVEKFIRLRHLSISKVSLQHSNGNSSKL